MLIFFGLLKNVKICQFEGRFILFCLSFIHWNIVENFRTAFFGLSLIAQTPDGAVALKDFGWETYRFRAHSIPTSLANTDAYQCAERRLSKLSTSSSTNKSTSPPSSEPVAVSVVKRDRETNVTKQFRFSQFLESTQQESKAARSLTMPSSILMNSNEIPIPIPDIRHCNRKQRQ